MPELLIGYQVLGSNRFQFGANPRKETVLNHKPKLVWKTTQDDKLQYVMAHIILHDNFNKLNLM